MQTVANLLKGAKYTPHERKVLDFITASPFYPNPSDLKYISELWLTNVRVCRDLNRLIIDILGNHIRHPKRFNGATHLAGFLLQSWAPYRSEGPAVTLSQFDADDNDIAPHSVAFCDLLVGLVGDLSALKSIVYWSLRVEYHVDHNSAALGMPSAKDGSDAYAAVGTKHDKMSNTMLASTFGGNIAPDADPEMALAANHYIHYDNPQSPLFQLYTPDELTEQPESIPFATLIPSRQFLQTAHDYLLQHQVSLASNTQRLVVVVLSLSKTRDVFDSAANGKPQGLTLHSNFQEVAAEDDFTTVRQFVPKQTQPASSSSIVTTTSQSPPSVPTSLPPSLRKKRLNVNTSVSQSPSITPATTPLAAYSAPTLTTGPPDARSQQEIVQELNNPHALSLKTQPNTQVVQLSNKEEVLVIGENQTLDSSGNAKDKKKAKKNKKGSERLLMDEEQEDFDELA